MSPWAQAARAQQLPVRVRGREEEVELDDAEPAAAADLLVLHAAQVVRDVGAPHVHLQSDPGHDQRLDF